MEVVERAPDLMVSPDQLLEENSVRWGLNPVSVDEMVKSIQTVGEIMQAIEVEVLPEPDGTAQYKVNDGHLRVAAARKLAAEGTEIPIPARVVSSTGVLDKLQRQLSANLDRQDMTPMDKAVAMKAMLDAGATKMDVRNRFPSRGGRGKTVVMQPLSNSSLNMHLSFLEFPKEIQNKIHTGELGVNSAYTLTLCPRDKWKGILYEAEELKKAEQQREERWEAKFLEAEKKKEEEAAKQKELEDKLKATEEAVGKVIQDIKVKREEQADLSHVAAVGAKTDEEKKKAAEAVAKAKADAQKLEKDQAEKQKELDKLRSQIQRAKDRMEFKAKEAKTSKAAPKKEVKAKSPTPDQIKKAAKKFGVEGKTPLTLPEIRTSFAALATLPDPKNPKTKAVFELMLRHISGDTIGEKEVRTGVQKLVGEYAGPKSKAKEEEKVA